MVEIVSKPQHGDAIGEVDGKPVTASPRMQIHLDDLTQKLNDAILGNYFSLPVYTVATLPDVPDVTIMGMIGVSDETGGAVPAFSDGTNWRRCTDRSIVS